LLREALDALGRKRNARRKGCAGAEEKRRPGIIVRLQKRAKKSDTILVRHTTTLCRFPRTKQVQRYRGWGVVDNFICPDVALVSDANAGSEPGTDVSVGFHKFQASQHVGRQLMSVETFKIIQIGSPIRRPHQQRKILISLGLNRIGRVADVPNTRATWGMIAKVRHLIRVVDEHLFEEHRLPQRHVHDEDADKRLLRNLIFELRSIRAEDIPEGGNKTPDFKLFKDGALRAYCEMKAPADGDVFDFPDDLAPGEVRVEVRKDPAIFNLAAHIAKSAKQFEAVNPDRTHPNILVIVNHGRRKGPADLRMALEGIRAPNGQRFYPLVNDQDQWRSSTAFGQRRAASTSMYGSIRGSEPGSGSSRPAHSDWPKPPTCSAFRTA
jgi:ribosomal protein L30